MNSKKRLKDILEGVEVKAIQGPQDVEIAGIASDSKMVRENFLFIAVKGAAYDGHDFIKEAVDKGANVIVTREGANNDFGPAVTKITAIDTRKIMAAIAHNFYNRPADKARVIGITGTNGKTTVSYLCEEIFKAAGFNVGIIGTVNYRYGPRQIPATNTTPGALQLVEMLNYMVTNNANYVVIEVSSHSLEQHRVRGIDFKTAVFTNITPEHLDYHKDMTQYKRAKAILFEGLGKHSTAVLNVDEEFGRELKRNLKSGVLTYGIDNGAEIKPKRFCLTRNGIELLVSTPKGEAELFSKLVGKFNLYNILASIGAGIAEGIDLIKIVKAIERLQLVPGRLEEIFCGQPFKVYVDYAHTDDALKNVLTALKDLSPRRIITLFGCGGDRDISKRPRMGRVASEFSDYVVVTTDNPRGEDPKKIAGQIAGGAKKNKLSSVSVILDRYEAIKKALTLAGEGDIVLLAGKGHETYQIFKNMVQPFDDREVAKKILIQMGYEACLQAKIS